MNKRQPVVLSLFILLIMNFDIISTTPSSTEHSAEFGPLTKRCGHRLWTLIAEDCSFPGTRDFCLKNGHQGTLPSPVVRRHVTTDGDQTDQRRPHSPASYEVGNLTRLTRSIHGDPWSRGKCKTPTDCCCKLRCPLVYREVFCCVAVLRAKYPDRYAVHSEGAHEEEHTIAVHDEAFEATSAATATNDNTVEDS